MKKIEVRCKGCRTSFDADLPPDNESYRVVQCPVCLVPANVRQAGSPPPLRESARHHADVLYRIALRARNLADMPMALLRKSEEPGVECDTRGKIIEACLVEEFEYEFNKIKEKLEEVDEV